MKNVLIKCVQFHILRTTPPHPTPSLSALSIYARANARLKSKLNHAYMARNERCRLTFIWNAGF